MQIGMLFHGQEHYGGRHDDLGLFQVVKLGKKFASMKSVQTENIGAVSKSASCLEASHSVKRRALLPVTTIESKTQLVCMDDYDKTEKEVVVASGGSTCYKCFELILKDSHGDYVYTESSQAYY